MYQVVTIQWSENKKWVFLSKQIDDCNGILKTECTDSVWELKF